MPLNRRSFLTLPLALGAAPLVRAAGTLPNIVILLADDLGWADVGYHGSEIRTPNIDRLAREGVRFERFYAFPLCSPTRSALLTARSPVRYGVLYDTIEPFEEYGLPVEEHLLPQSLKAAGYQTVQVGKWHLGHSHVKYFPNSRGFEHSYGHLNGRIDYFTHARDGGLDWHRDGKTLHEEGYSTDLMAAEAVRVVEGRDRRRPLFLYLAFNAPHFPLEAPERYIARYSAIADPERRTYAAMVECMDEGIGRVLAALERQGMASNTLVLFLSDNGGSTGNGGRNAPLRGGKRTTFEGGIRVPAALRWPAGLKGGGAGNQVMSVLDVFPTFCGAAGVTPRNTLPLDGKNLWPSIAASKTEPREDIFFGTGSGARFHYAVISRQWKLVREISRKGGEETNYLFDVERDPEEKADLAARHPDMVKDLAAKIDRWRALHPAKGVFRGAKEAPPGRSVPKQWAEAARRD